MVTDTQHIEISIDGGSLLELHKILILKSVVFVDKVIGDIQEFSHATGTLSNHCYRNNKKLDSSL